MVTGIRYSLLVGLILFIVVDVFLEKPLITQSIEWIVFIVLLFLAVEAWIKHYRFITIAFMVLALALFFLKLV